MPESAGKAIREALSDPNPQQSVEATLSLTAHLIESADSNVRVKKTGHFNNTFIPDFILDWPKDSRAQREVYLRTTSDREWLREDVTLVPARESMFITLDELDNTETETEKSASSALSSHSSERGVLVTEVETVENLAGATTSGGVALFSSALLKGGRGYIQASSTPQILEAVIEGIAAAQNADGEKTAGLLLTADALLSRSEDQKFTEVLQALWIGGGGLPSAFPPSELEARAGLDTASLRFLLENRDLTDSSFWPRLARAIDLQTLLNLGELSNDSSLDALMSAAVSTFTAKVCFTRPINLAQHTESSWTLSNGQLMLAVGTNAFYIARTSGDLADVGRVDSVPETQAILSRVRSNGYELNEIYATDGSRSVRMSDTDGDLAELSTGTLEVFFSGEARVDRLSLSSPRRRKMTVTPTLGRVAARTNGKLYLDDLVDCAATILVGLEGEDLMSVRRVIQTETGIAELLEGAELRGASDEGVDDLILEE